MGIENKDKKFETTHFLGVVVKNEDPKYQGRCKVRVFGIYDDIADDDLPWAQQVYDLSFGDGGGSGRISIPKLGSVVHVQFNNSNYYFPEYKAVQELSPDLIEELKSSYLGTHSLLFDATEKLKLYYTKKKGLVLDLQESKIIISNDNSITIIHKDQKSSIELRGGKITGYAESEMEDTAKNRIKHTSEEVWTDGKTVKLGHVASYSAICAEPLWIFLKMLASAVDAKMPSSPGVMYSMAEQFEQLSTSDAVKVTKSN